jgi:hypothetical protein
MAFGEGWTGRDGTVRAVSGHSALVTGPDCACSQSQNCTRWVYTGLRSGGGTDNGAPLWEAHMSHEWQSSQKMPGPASAGTYLFPIAAVFWRQRYSRVPRSVLVSPAARRLVHSVTWSKNSAAFQVFFLRHHIPVNRTFKTRCYHLQVTY